MLGAPIYVRPEGGRGDRTWAYAGVGRFDEVLRGGVGRGEIVTAHHGFAPDRPVCSRVRDTEIAPQAPRRSERPGKAVALLYPRYTCNGSSSPARTCRAS